MKRWIHWPVWVLVIVAGGLANDASAESPATLPTTLPTTRPTTPPATRPLTFAVIGDTHVGHPATDRMNAAMIDQLNRMPLQVFPADVGGRVGQLRGVIHVGDMTESGLAEQWQKYLKSYGTDGADGQLKFPIFPTIGNHDLIYGRTIHDALVKRHGSLPYAFEWDGVRFIALGMYPDDDAVTFLRKDLADHDRSTPYILFMHYPLDGLFSGGWTADQKKALANVIDGHNILAIFHGHYHLAGHYQWNGRDVFLPGSPRHNSHLMLVVRIDEQTLSIVQWNCDRRTWGKAYRRPIKAGGQSARQSAPVHSTN